MRGQGRALAGVRVLVTRPAHQADALCAAIVEAGGTPVRFPTIEIQPLEPSEATVRRLAALGAGDLVIFVSANAVHWAGPYLPRPFPEGVEIATVGAGTAKAVREAGLPTPITPAAGFDSEALLALAPLREVGGRRVLIVRGEGGRALLGETLRRRGAEVAYAEVYRRGLPAVDVAPLLRDWEAGGIDVVVTTSAHGLHHLAVLLGRAGGALLAHTPLVVIGERMLQMARTMGVRAPVLVSGASDAALLQTLVRWRRSPDAT